MNLHPRLFLLPVLGAALASPLPADLDVSIAAEIRLGRVVAPPPPEIVVIGEPAQKGPPPWAPAHGFRRNRDYYYYPGTNVYYRPADRMWIYLDGRDWRVGVSLPASIHVDFERSVSLTMETDRPYEFHDKVRAYYPGDYFVTRVRVKEKGGKPDKTHAAPGHDEDGNRGKKSDKAKGKGKNK